MCCGNPFKSLLSILFYYSILCIFLLQLYSQYSTLPTLRSKIENQKDGRNTLTNFQLTKTKQYDFNLNKIQEYFDDNALMKIPFLKRQVLKLIDHFNNKENKLDIRNYMHFYLIGYDIICIIIVYIFLFCASIKAGLITILFQSVRFYFNAKRIQKFNSRMSLYEIIKSKWENIVLFRGWSFFNPEGFLIIEFLCNFVVILEIILLIKYICDRRRYRKIRKMNVVEDDIDDKVEENEEKDGKNSGKIYEIKENGDENENESNEDNKSNDNINNNSEISNKKPEEGKLNDLFEKEEGEEISDEKSDNNSDELGETKNNN
jgi:hypothetical protein